MEQYKFYIFVYHWKHPQLFNLKMNLAYIVFVSREFEHDSLFIRIAPELFGS